MIGCTMHFHIGSTWRSRVRKSPRADHTRRRATDSELEWLDCASPVPCVLSGVLSPTFAYVCAYKRQASSGWQRALGRGLGEGIAKCQDHADGR